MRFRISLALLSLATLVSGVQAADQVIPKSGRPISGKIVTTTPYEITIEDDGGDTETVSVNNIDSVRFDSEPPRMNIIRGSVASGGYENAITDIDELLKAGDITNPMIIDDLNYLKAISQAKLALRGGAAINDAGSTLNTYVKGADKSYHYLEASKTLGDLFVRAGLHDQAIAQYAKLASASWDEAKFESNVLQGRAKFAKGDVDGAKSNFESVISQADPNKEATKDYLLAATLGKAECLSLQGQVEAATTAVRKVIADANPDNKDLHARAYSTLGRCYIKSDEPKKAMLAFLHVDLLYFQNAELHKEALENLLKIFNDLGDREGAARAQGRLQLYLGS